MITLPSKVDRFVVAHDFAEMNRGLELLAVHKERNVVGLEGREHARNVRDMHVGGFKLHLQFQQDFFVQGPSHQLGLKPHSHTTIRYTSVEKKILFTKIF